MCEFCFTINHFVSFSRIVHLTKTNQLSKYLDKKMHSLFLVFNGTQKSNYFMCEQQKFHELFNKVLL